MKKKDFRLYLLVLTILISNSAIAQKKKILESEEEVTEAAVSAIEASIEEGEFQKFIEKKEIKGSYVMDITIKNKGEVASIRTISREGEIMHQNELKDFVMTYKFPFKMPKNKSYKFRYEFKIN